ncbi:MAG: SDR family oxidoreductase [Pseudomonas sp.]|uniref:UDP-glucose 4-epimerase family protein n=1 Tax=Pseudomonas sp. TaxID=306 RepID=UPI003BB7457E
MNKILLTGSTGFIGRAVYKRLLLDAQYELLLAARSCMDDLPESIVQCQISDIDGATEWQSALEAVDVVIHYAARVHVMDDHASDSLTKFRNVNVSGTLNLARQAAAIGVKRFISISSIKVNGEKTLPGQPYTPDDALVPMDPYAISKLEAERGLCALAAETGMEVVIIRPVLVYGPGVKAIFRSMMSWLSKGVPLPLGGIDNKRSLVALDNLVDLMVTCINHPAAANQTFLVSDGEDLSTSELLRRMAAALGVPARLLPVPAVLLDAGAALLGQRAMAQRLCGSLQVDIGKTCELLNWSPPVSVDQALRKTAKHFLECRAK